MIRVQLHLLNEENVLTKLYHTKSLSRHLSKEEANRYEENVLTKLYHTRSPSMVLLHD